METIKMEAFNNNEIECDITKLNSDWCYKFYLDNNTILNGVFLNYLWEFGNKSRLSIQVSHAGRYSVPMVQIAKITTTKYEISRHITANYNPSYEIYNPNTPL